MASAGIEDEGHVGAMTRLRLRKGDPLRDIMAAIRNLPWPDKLSRDSVFPYGDFCQSVKFDTLSFDYLSNVIFPSLPALKSFNIILAVFSSSIVPPEAIAPLLLPINFISS